MRNRKCGKQILSILLTGLLTLNVPMAALAESEEVLISEEQVQAVDITDADEYAIAEEEIVEETADEEEEILETEEEQLMESETEEEQPIESEEEEQLLGETEIETEEPQTELYDDKFVVQEADVSDFPTEIPAGETYKLTEDITLTSGQQIKNLSGTLDGQGHTITLSGTALAENVSGTIQNLGVKGNVSVSTDHKGTLADTLTGTIRNSYSIVNIDDGDTWSEVGGLVGTLTGGTIQNCYFAGGGSALMMYGIASYTSGVSQVSNCYYVASMGAFGTVSSAPQQTNCVKKTGGN